MKSEALQELVKKIFSDEKTKQQFMSNPESVLSRFSLTKQEKRAVLSTYTKMGLIASDSPQLEATLAPQSGWFAPTPL
jgi:hypothetical protein